MPRHSALTQLRDLLGTRFSESELENLCFDFGIDYENLPGRAKIDKARELILYMERQNMISDLIKQISIKRPDIKIDSTGNTFVIQESSQPSLPFPLPASPLEDYRQILNRPAFRVSCIYELFISELKDAIDDAQAAFNTGHIYSRSGRLLGELSSILDYQPEESEQGFYTIPDLLTELKRTVVEFEESFREVMPNYDRHNNFTAMIFSIRDVTDSQTIRQFIQKMDKIDTIRNAILQNMNSSLEPNKHLPLIKTSSESIRDAYMRNGLGYLIKYL